MTFSLIEHDCVSTSGSTDIAGTVKWGRAVIGVVCVAQAIFRLFALDVPRRAVTPHSGVVVFLNVRQPERLSRQPLTYSRATTAEVNYGEFRAPSERTVRLFSHDGKIKQ